MRDADTGIVASIRKYGDVNPYAECIPPGTNYDANIRFIESRTDSRFEIVVTLPRPSFTLGPEESVQIEVSLEGGKRTVEKRLLRIPGTLTADYTYITDQVPVYETANACRIHAMTFGELYAEPGHELSNLEAIDEFCDRGKITVTVRKGEFIDVQRPEYKPSPPLYSLGTSLNMLEEKSHSLKTIPVITRERDRTSLGSKHAVEVLVSGNSTSFTFFYASKEARHHTQANCAASYNIDQDDQDGVQGSTSNAIQHESLRVKRTASTIDPNEHATAPLSKKFKVVPIDLTEDQNNMVPSQRGAPPDDAPLANYLYPRTSLRLVAQRLRGQEVKSYRDKTDRDFVDETGEHVWKSEPKPARSRAAVPIRPATRSQKPLMAWDEPPMSRNNIRMEPAKYPEEPTSTAVTTFIESALAPRAGLEEQAKPSKSGTSSSGIVPKERMHTPAGNETRILASEQATKRSPAQKEKAKLVRELEKIGIERRLVELDDDKSAVQREKATLMLDLRRLDVEQQLEELQDDDGA